MKTPAGQVALAVSTGALRTTHYAVRSTQPCPSTVVSKGADAGHAPCTPAGVHSPVTLVSTSRSPFIVFPSLSFICHSVHL